MTTKSGALYFKSFTQSFPGLSLIIASTLLLLMVMSESALAQQAMYQQCKQMNQQAKAAQQGAEGANNASGNAANGMMGQSTGNSNAAGLTGGGTCGMSDSMAGPSSSCQAIAQQCKSICDATQNDQQGPWKSMAQAPGQECQMIAQKCGMMGQQAAANKAQCEKAKKAEKSAKPPQMPKPPEKKPEENPEPKENIQCPPGTTQEGLQVDGVTPNCKPNEEAEPEEDPDVIERDDVIDSINSTQDNGAALQFDTPNINSAFAPVRNNQRTSSVYQGEGSSNEMEDPFGEDGYYKDPEQEEEGVPYLNDYAVSSDGSRQTVAAYRPVGAGSRAARAPSSVGAAKAKGPKKAWSPELSAEEIGAEVLDPVKNTSPNPILAVQKAEEEIVSVIRNVSSLSGNQMKLCSVPNKIKKLQGQGGVYAQEKAAQLKGMLNQKMNELGQPDADFGLSMICNHFTRF